MHIWYVAAIIATIFPHASRHYIPASFTGSTIHHTRIVCGCMPRCAPRPEWGGPPRPGWGGHREAPIDRIILPPARVVFDGV